MGDWLGRIPSLLLLDPKPNENIFDAGCGEGLLTSYIAECGAKVTGGDRALPMLEHAKSREQNRQLGMRFVHCDIGKQLPVPEGSIDGVNCIAVLMHNSPKECASFFTLAFRALKSGGRIVVSITHPYQYQSGSPTTNGQSKWAQFDQLETGTLDISRKFMEHYRNIHGQVFNAEVWYHPDWLFPKLLLDSGFVIVKRQDTYVRPEDVAQSPYWEGSPWGHPAYLQFLAVKP